VWKEEVSEKFSKWKSRLYLCTSKLQSHLLTFRLNEEPHLMWDYRTSESLRWSLFPVGFPRNIRLLKTSQAQFSSTREIKNPRFSYSCNKDKTLQTSSMVWCSSVRRFCFCSLRRTRTETHHERMKCIFPDLLFPGEPGKEMTMGKGEGEWSPQWLSWVLSLIRG